MKQERNVHILRKCVKLAEVLEKGMLEKLLKKIDLGWVYPYRKMMLALDQEIWASAWQNQHNGTESLLCVQWVAKGPRFLHADSEDSDQTGRMPSLIWVFAERTSYFFFFFFFFFFSFAGSIFSCYLERNVVMFSLAIETLKWTCETNVPLVEKT